MNRTIGIVSAKGGVGKTVTTVNLAAALTAMSKPSLAVDADIKTSGIGLHLGMFHFPVTINDLLSARGSVLEAIYIHTSGLRFIPASVSLRDAKLTRLRRLLTHPALNNNTIFVDTPPGLEQNFHAAIRACPEAVIVTTPELTAVVDAVKTVQAAQKARTTALGVIVNRSRGGKEELRAAEIEQMCELPILGIVPEDRTVTKSMFRRTPAYFMDPYAPASLSFAKIAANLAGEKYVPPKYPFLKRLGRMIR